eukprot:2215717-Amphidinium_carterae.1
MTLFVAMNILMRTLRNNLLNASLNPMYVARTPAVHPLSERGCNMFRTFSGTVIQAAQNLVMQRHFQLTVSASRHMRSHQNKMHAIQYRLKHNSLLTSFSATQPGTRADRKAMHREVDDIDAHGKTCSS